MAQPRATLDDLYNQNQTMIDLLVRMDSSLHLIREATYGSTSAESGDHYDSPKHGAFGAAEAIGQLEMAIHDLSGKLTK